jgi:D-glycero-beta-D-manno-heptose 1-phosphate adenylyltransferase
MNNNVFNNASEFLDRLKDWRKERVKIVFTNGCFDILHVGHIRCLKEARSLGDCLVVGLNSDTSVKRLKGASRPINPQWERAEILASLKMVDAVVIFEEDTPLEILGIILPDVLVKGGDYRIEDIVGSELVQKNGGIVKSVGLTVGKSTTAIIDKMTKTK